MYRGLSVPLTVNKGGGAKKESETSQLDKLVVLALQEGDDDNPFQDLGLSPRIIYNINDDAAKYDAKEEIERLLSSFRGRLQLSSDGIRIQSDQNTQQTQEGDSHVAFEYVNLDTNTPREFEAPFEELGDKT